MSSLKNQLIRLGNNEPSLRKHLRPILDEIITRDGFRFKSEVVGDKSKRSGVGVFSSVGDNPPPQDIFRKMIRKPSGWDRLPSLDEELIVKHSDYLSQLEVIPFYDVYGDLDAFPAQEFIDGRLPVSFIMNGPGDLHLIDTEGYDYARYAIKIDQSHFKNIS